MGGGGNWEFEYYTNNRSNSFVKDGILYLQPTLTEDTIGVEAIKSGTMDIWGASPADLCTGNAFWGCKRDAAGSGNYLNPIQSARIRTAQSFAFTYGVVEVRAKLPKGDWIWPAIWLMPKYNEFGNWPASGEIDLAESRGNSLPCDIGNTQFGSTLHWGPSWQYDAFEKAHASYTSSNGSLADEFHIYKLLWNESTIKTYIDDKKVLDFSFDEDMFSKGGFA